MIKIFVFQKPLFTDKHAELHHFRREHVGDDWSDESQDMAAVLRPATTDNIWSLYSSLRSRTGLIVT